MWFVKRGAFLCPFFFLMFEQFLVQCSRGSGLELSQATVTEVRNINNKYSSTSQNTDAC